MLHFLESHEALAAWVQAVGSILIIGATAAIAFWQSRQIMRREEEMHDEFKMLLVTCADACIDALDTLIKRWSPGPHGDVIGDFAEAYTRHEFLTPMEYLAVVPLQQLGDPALATAVFKFRTIMGAIVGKLDSARGDRYKIEDAVAFCIGNKTIAFNSYASILRLCKPGVETDDRISHVARRC